VAIGLLQIVQTSRATTANFEIQKLEQQKLELGAQVRQLEAEVAGLSSLARIEAEAKRLGLQKPQAVQAVEVNVAAEEAPVNHLPTRFSPAEAEQPEDAGGDSTWWGDLLQLLPFH
jgi:cell division protein FtsL